MAIDFVPGLNQDITVDVPPYLALESPDAGADIRLRFRATLGKEEYSALQRAGGSVQLWSDIAAARTAGEWGAATFERVDSAPVNPNDHLVHLPLGEDADLPSQNADLVHLELELAVSIDRVKLREGAVRFAFTYRVSYPSGRCEWLGLFGQNGGLALKADAGAVSSGRLDRDGQTVVFDAARELLMLRGYRAWGLSREGQFTSTDAALLLLAPRADTLFVHPFLAVSTAATDTVSVHQNDGNVAISRLGSATLHILAESSSMQSSLAEIMGHSNISSVQVCTTLAALFLASLAPSLPLSVLAIPWNTTFTASGNLASVMADVHWLSGLLEGPDNHSAPSQSASFFCVSSLYDAHVLPYKGKSLSLGIPSTGALFVLAPVHTLANDRMTCGVAINTTYSKVSLESSGADAGLILPTPPPSPPARLSPSSNHLEGEPEFELRRRQNWQSTLRDRMMGSEHRYFSSPTSATGSWLAAGETYVASLSSMNSASSMTSSGSISTLLSSDSITTLSPSPSGECNGANGIGEDVHVEGLRERRPNAHPLTLTTLGLGFVRAPFALLSPRAGNSTDGTQSNRARRDGVVLPRPGRDRTIAACFGVLFTLARMLLFGGIFFRVFRLIFGSSLQLVRSSIEGNGPGENGSARRTTDDARGSARSPGAEKSTVNGVGSSTSATSPTVGSAHGSPSTLTSPLRQPQSVSQPAVLTADLGPGRARLVLLSLDSGLDKETMPCLDISLDGRIIHDAEMTTLRGYGPQRQVLQAIAFDALEGGRLKVALADAP